MADPNFVYDPVTGWNDANIFPTTPSKAAVRGLLQRLFDQARDAINALIPWANLKFATKAEVNGVVAGQINTIDETTGKHYVIFIDNGIPGLREVG